MGGVEFIPFPKPKRNLEKCKRWIKACGRPHDQLNVNVIDGNYHMYVCMKLKHLVSTFFHQCTQTLEFNTQSLKLFILNKVTRSGLSSLVQSVYNEDVNITIFGLHKHGHFFDTDQMGSQEMRLSPR